MKKLIALLGMCALATGAWAAHDWTWTIDIYKVDPSYSMPSSLQAVLGANSDNKLAYLSLYMFDQSTSDPTKYTLNTTTATSVANKLGIDTQYISGIISISDDNNNVGYNKIHMDVTFSSNVNLRNYLENGYTALLEATVDGVSTWQYIQGAWTTPNSNTYGSEATYNPVPEPTSAMLMLLGFAGLALKRKRI